MKLALSGPLITGDNRKVIERALAALSNFRLTITGKGASSTSRISTAQNAQTVSIDISGILDAGSVDRALFPSVLSGSTGSATIDFSTADPAYSVVLFGNLNVTFTGFAQGKSITFYVSSASGTNSIAFLNVWGPTGTSVFSVNSTNTRKAIKVVCIGSTINDVYIQTY